MHFSIHLFIFVTLILISTAKKLFLYEHYLILRNPSWLYAYLLMQPARKKPLSEIYRNIVLNYFIRSSWQGVRRQRVQSARCLSARCLQARYPSVGCLSARCLSARYPSVRWLSARFTWHAYLLVVFITFLNAKLSFVFA